MSVGAFLGDLPVWSVALALVIAGTAIPFLMGGLSSFVTEVIPDERRAYAIDALAYNLGAVAGPAAVAAATALGSARVATLLMAGSALFGALATILLRLRPLPGEPHRSMLATIAAGFRHIATHRPLAVVTTSGTVSQFGSGGLAIAAVALAVARTEDAAQVAITVTAFALGGLLGALWSSTSPPRFRPEVTMGVGFAATGVFTVLAALDVGTMWTIAAIGVSGVFTAASSAAMLLVRKQQSPSSPRSQVFTVGAGRRAAGLTAEALIAIGVIWIASGAMLAAHPRSAESIDR